MIVATEPNLEAAIAAHRMPFLWLAGGEKPAGIDKLYKAEGRPFLLAESGSAGVYPGNAHWLMPKGANGSWVRQHLAPLTATTNLFPESANVFFHTGDLGDIIASLPVIRQLGGGELVIGHVDKIGNRETMRGARYESIKPLLLAQEYITDVSYNDYPKDLTYDIAHFRQTQPVRGESLSHWQARHFGIPNLDVSPWLEIEHETHGNVIVARSGRYHNPLFPWRDLLLKNRGSIAFVGLPMEHEQLQQDTMCKIPYHKTANLVEVAQVIAGAKLFIGNQSCPFWLAAGLGVPLIQETYFRDQNSRIERSNALYSGTEKELDTLRRLP